MKLPKFKNLLQKIVNLPLVRRILNWTKEKSLPGFFKVPIYDVFVFLFNELKRYALNTRANSMAFSFFLSIFPSLIVLLTLLPYFRDYILTHIPGGMKFENILYREIKLIMPGNAGDIIFQTIEDITTQPRADLLSIGFLLAIFFASNGMMNMMKGFEKSYKTTYTHWSQLNKRLVAISLTFVLGFLLISSILIIIIGNLVIGWVTDYLNLGAIGATLFTFFRYFAITALIYSGISLIYRYGVAVKKKFSFFSPGATLATVLSILSSQVFSFYVENFNTYNKLYGSIGTVIVVMLWIQINSFIILLGYELNASIAVNRDIKLERPDDDE